MKRYLDTFFRYWPIVMMPVIVLTIGQFALIRHAPRTITTSMNVLVEDLVTGTNIDGSQWNTPAQNQAANLTQWLQSPSFAMAVAHGSPIYSRMLRKVANPSTVAFNDLSAHIVVAAKGYRLLGISYTTTAPNWQEATQVVMSFLVTVREKLLSLGKQAAAAETAYYTAQLRSSQSQLRNSTQQLSDYMSKQGISTDQLLTQLPDDPTLETLYQQNETNQASVASIQQKLSAYAAQSTSSGSANDQSGLMIVDMPSTVVLSNTKTMLMDLAIAFVLGLLLGGGFLVVKTATDRTIRFADEVPALLYLPVLAIVPYDRALATEQGHVPLKGAETNGQRRVAGLGRAG